MTTTAAAGSTDHTVADAVAAAAAVSGYDMFSGLPVPGGLSEQLWHDAQPAVMQALHHPFVQALAQGTLDKSSFQHYVLQDLFFLTRYARAYAAAIDKCTKPHHSAAKAVVSELLLGVDAELKLHGSYAAKWGVAVDEWVWPSAATAAYTDFLIDIAHDPETSVVEVLAAMIPCSRLYGFLGCQLSAASRGQARHMYSEWLDTYSGAEYLASPVMKEELFDKIAHTVPYGELLIVRKGFEDVWFRG